MRELDNDEALREIQKLLDGTVWTSNTLDEVATIMRAAGWQIRDSACRVQLDELPEDYVSKSVWLQCILALARANGFTLSKCMMIMKESGLKRYKENH